jgi:hypothetical protein
MTVQPVDVSWLLGEYGEFAYCFVYVRATPEEVVTRLGGRWTEFEPGPFPGDSDRILDSGGSSIGVTPIGEWAFIVDTAAFGLREDVVTRLSAGTRLVSQFALSVEGVDDIHWCEDGEVRYYLGGDDKFVMETPDELVPVMAEIDRVYPSWSGFYDGPAFLLVEHLTGIRLTEELVRDSTFMWGSTQVR